MKYFLFFVFLVGFGALGSSFFLDEPTEMFAPTSTEHEMWKKLRMSNLVKVVQRCDIGGDFTASNKNFFLKQKTNKNTSKFDHDTSNTFENMFVLQKNTSLYWRRCGVGATSVVWCDKAQKYGVNEINEAVASLESRRARLPTVDELKGIVEKSCEMPSINLSVFPKTQADMYWAYKPETKEYYTVDFADGTVKKATGREAAYIRTVVDLDAEDVAQITQESSSLTDIFKGVL
jgi:hypothetical protein